MRFFDRNHPFLGAMATTAVAALLLASGACRGNAPAEAPVDSEQLARAAASAARDAAAEKAAAEEAQRALAAARAEAAAVREQLEAAQQALAERQALAAEQERLLRRQEEARQEQARLAAREAALEERNRALMELERDLEVREINLAVEQERLQEREEALAEVEAVAAPVAEGGDTGTPQASARRQVEASLLPGKVLEVEILETLSSRTSRRGDTFPARLVQDLRAEDGTLVIAAGAEITGRVVDVVPLQRVGGRAAIELEFTHVAVAPGETVEIRASFAEMGRDGRKDKKKILAAAAAGALLGKVLTGKGAGEVLLGAAVGAAAGTAVVARAEGRDAVIPAGQMVALQLEEVVTVTVEMTGPVFEQGRGGESRERQ